MSLETYNTAHVPLEILYADQDIVVVNKPYGLLSVPGVDPRLQDAVTTRIAKDHDFVEAVHRLDMATSGIIVLAVSKLADAELKKQFRERQTSKTYYAVVRGIVAKDHQFIELPLGCDWPLRPRQRVDYGSTGKYSLTECQVLERDYSQQVTLVQLTPHTGRSHQLRVHMQALGHPIVGDKFYDPWYNTASYFRLCLHAGHLGFKHPRTNEDLVFNCLPDFTVDYQIPEFIELQD
ncbi:pseudouridine synthase [Psittacicella hinzii]|uniref:Dual-specificity RNA pseudouridine synthase RluA n=1 Tax=Psittacicella hinzii TaxID=2028575 RepID=A0A3A1YLL0_9GAMM|nr:RluA family pseudouridine synthase [Psittacicella hinzii]RIY38441.1 hypothetical protein CKF58_04270 [Psittacicella hinzii]